MYYLIKINPYSVSSYCFESSFAGYQKLRFVCNKLIVEGIFC